MTASFKNFLDEVTNISEPLDGIPDKTRKRFHRPAVEDYIRNLFDDQEKLLKRSTTIDNFTVETFLGYCRNILIAKLSEFDHKSPEGVILDDFDDAIIEDGLQDFITKHNQE